MSAREKGANLSRTMVDRVVDQLATNGIKTVNLGGNEPLFTSGLDSSKTLLPYIISSLVGRRILVGLTTAGITINYIATRHPDAFDLLNDVDVSIDSPFEQEHNENRGASLFGKACAALRRCQEAGMEHTVVMCGMFWNLSDRHIDGLVELARRTGSNVRINFIKPTEPRHMNLLPSPELFYRATERLLGQCGPVELGESLLSTLIKGTGNGCPCGTKSFRIHSITPNGKIPVSPCVYMHDYRVGDLLVDDLYDIVRLPQFRAFRQRLANPEKIQGCAQCDHLATCRGGCAARAYLTTSARGDLFVQDPYCFQRLTSGTPRLLHDESPASQVTVEKTLVHRDYLCTLIVTPR
ncbi:MAG: SPASM domain-containing protein [Candidatus Liptonbacteria bacterium]|nr:SPASM domain-containing protein [Candidatus Liptonbacteria bacterium]